MIDVGGLSEGLSLLWDWRMPVAAVLGMSLGLIIGLIPGLTAAIGLAIVLPFTFQLDALVALMFLTAIYTGSLTGGGILAILLNTPGTPGAAATTLDGYPMAKRGRANEALGLQITASVFGGAVGYLALMFFIQPMSSIALKFQSAEMLALTVFVLVAVGVLQSKYLFRSLFAGAMGLMIATVGTSLETGVPRGTYGLINLEDGLPIVLCAIGLFAIPEMIDCLSRATISQSSSKITHSPSQLWGGVSGALSNWPTLCRGSAIGIGIGILPAAGATLASLLSYALAQRLGGSSDSFGHGEPKGVLAAESANNASEGGAMAILLTLGIPGSASTAVIMGGFMLHGLVPGTQLIHDNGALVYGLIIGNLLQMIVMIGIALFIAYYAARIVIVPTSILVPFLSCTLAIGAFGFRDETIDVYIVFLFGIIGWFCRRYHFTPLSLMIGLFLGDLLDQTMIRFSILYSYEPWTIFERPIAITMFAITLLLLMSRFARWILRERLNSQHTPGVQEGQPSFGAKPAHK